LRWTGWQCCVASTTCARAARGTGQDQLDAQLRTLVESKIPMRSRRTPGWKEDLRKDTASHFILRLAHCRTEELRLWFLAQESYLFRARLERLNGDGLADFIRREQLVFDVVSEEEKAAKVNVLQASFRDPLLEFERTAFYKVPFTEALELVAQRHVHLEGGLAYVPAAKLVVVIAGRFRAQLSASLALASRVFGHVVELDARIAPLLMGIDGLDAGKDLAEVKALDITANDVDILAGQGSMPLCMQQLHRGLKRNHKLKHFGRLQYGLFLKQAGLSLEETTEFFRREFTKIMTADEYTKGYAYGWRHMHGSLSPAPIDKNILPADYTSSSCVKIIMSPGAHRMGEHHGCPYRHYNEGDLNSEAGLLERTAVARCPRIWSLVKCCV
jgi:DNA primase large subunit